MPPTFQSFHSHWKTLHSEGKCHWFVLFIVHTALWLLLLSFRPSGGAHIVGVIDAPGAAGTPAPRPGRRTPPPASGRLSRRCRISVVPSLGTLPSDVAYPPGPRRHSPCKSVRHPGRCVCATPICRYGLWGVLVRLPSAPIPVTLARRAEPAELRAGPVTV